MKKISLLLVSLVAVISVFSGVEAIWAQELHQNLQGVWKAEVLKIIKEEKVIIPGTETETIIQTIEAQILEGERKSEVVTLENDYLPLRVGDYFFMNYLITIDGNEIYSVRDIDRRSSLIFFALLFVAVIIYFGRWQGLRSIMSLLGTFLVIIYVLLPLLLKGYPPVLTSSLIAAAVLFMAIFLTHGFNRESGVAFSGTVIAVILTGILAWMAVGMTRLTGFGNEEAVYLNFATLGNLNFSGLLLGGIIVGVLGVLDDIAITQVAVVRELKESAHNLSKSEIYHKAMKIGREHAGALVNTLALAYAGATLPLLLLFSASQINFEMIINQEAVATEIIRTIIGSIGLILTIPITTALAVYFLGSGHA